mmetsp:Transcript_1326/g.2040  ORF Transcript_1326/g.2040 Transcript_1326/m.2040 type:complete len:296 (+) Transcript_1326:97-984(+)
MALSNPSVHTEVDDASTFIPQHSPTILNASNHSMTVFQERGTFYNCQVLKPGEAVSMTRKQTGPFNLVPYKIHAIVGDESCLPSSQDSTRNLIKVTAIPAAFVAGCLATAVSAGMLVGPSAALGPLVSGMVVNGVVIDSTALAAGGLVATRASAVADLLLKEKPDFFMNKTGNVRPGQRYFVVSGGLADGTVGIEEMSKKKFEKNYTVDVWKGPLDKKILQDPTPAEEKLVGEDNNNEDVKVLSEECEDDVELLLLKEEEAEEKKKAVSSSQIKTPLSKRLSTHLSTRLPHLVRK